MDTVLSYILTNTEKKATEQLLTSGHRLDKRDFLEPRSLKISLSEGSSIIHLGNTIISCHTTYTEEIPDENRPNEGLFSLSLTTPYRLDNQFRIELLRSIKAAFIKTKALDLESLIITVGVSCYHLNSELVILDNDGGIVDACTISLAMSLLSLHLPGTRGPRPVLLHHLPLSVTFLAFTPEKILADPTLLEASVCKNSITIFANANGYVCGLSKNGGPPIPSSTLISLMHQAISISTEWHIQLMQQMGDNAPPNLVKIVSSSQIKTSMKMEEKRAISKQEEPEQTIEIHEEDTAEKEEEEIGDIDPELAAFLGI